MLDGVICFARLCFVIRMCVCLDKDFPIVAIGKSEDGARKMSAMCQATAVGLSTFAIREKKQAIELKPLIRAKFNQDDGCARQKGVTFG